jgi:hypothetical protein
MNTKGACEHTRKTKQRKLKKKKKRTKKEGGPTNEQITPKLTRQKIIRYRLN